MVINNFLLDNLFESTFVYKDTDDINDKKLLLGANICFGLISGYSPKNAPSTETYGIVIQINNTSRTIQIYITNRVHKVRIFYNNDNVIGAWS